MDNNVHSELLDFIVSAPDLKEKACAKATLLWDSGVTSTMKQGNYNYIDSLKEIWIEISSYYPNLHFNGQTLDDYISDYIKSRFIFHNAHLEPNGALTGGTIVGVIAGGCVISDLERMIEDTVCSLSQELDFDFNNWKKQWKNKKL
jgi:hypothetical protein